MQVERQAESRSPVLEKESTVPVTEAMPVSLETEKVKKVKKRKRAKPADDIDAIFAGL